MASRRGAANLERFNAARSAGVLPQLRHELQLCKKRKLDFKSVGLLAGYLSDRVKVHRTTFLRNMKYRAMLMEYLSSQPGSISRISDAAAEPAVLQAKLAAARLETSNLRNEVKELTARLARQSQAGTMSEGIRSDLDFANLAMLVVNVMGRVSDSIEVDYKRRTIVDLAAKPSERVIAGPERAGQFIAWLEQNQAIPAVGRLGKQKTDAE